MNIKEVASHSNSNLTIIFSYLALQIKGYKKEIIDGVSINEETGEEEPVQEKIYYHKWCNQLKEWKEEHSAGWKKVMDGLIGHFRAIEEAERRRKEAEERARQEAIRKAQEERRLAEEAARQRALEAEQRRAEEESRLAAEAALKAAQEAAEEEKRRKKEASLKYKIGKKLSAVKKTLKSGCTGKKNVDESATGDEQAPEEK